MSKEKDQKDQKDQTILSSKPILSVYTAEEYAMITKMPKQKAYILIKLNKGKSYTSEKWKEIVSKL